MRNLRRAVNAIRRTTASVATTLYFGAAVTAGAALALGFTAAPAYAQATTVPAGGGGGVTVTPTSQDFPGGAMMQKLINWAGQFGLWGSVASLLIGAGIWGISSHFGNGYQAGKGKILAAAGAIGAVLTGLAPVIVNGLYNAAKA